MSTTYRLVQWNRHKKLYDLAVASAVVLFVAIFILVSTLLVPTDRAPSAPITLMRALGVCAILLLHIILAIGPLARLSPRFAPLLYNRRHLGVIFFLVALLHFLVALGFYGGFGITNPLAALLSANYRTADPLGIPFETLGFAALIIFFLMAATSHDFWLHNLGPRAWKWLHMLVYPAYALVLLHVALGALRGPSSLALAAIVALGAVAISALHLTAGLVQLRRDARHRSSADWIDAGPLTSIPDTRAVIVRPRNADEIAVFRQGDTAHAVSNRCVHQGGPLGEGQIIDGCVTCPWHGYQFDPATGCSPPPFTDRVRTYPVRIDKGRVLVSPTPTSEPAHD